MNSPTFEIFLHFHLVVAVLMISKLNALSVICITFDVYVAFHFLIFGITSIWRLGVQVFYDGNQQSINYLSIK